MKTEKGSSIHFLSKFQEMLRECIIDLQNRRKKSKIRVFSKNGLGNGPLPLIRSKIYVDPLEAITEELDFFCSPKKVIRPSEAVSEKLLLLANYPLITFLAISGGYEILIPLGLGSLYGKKIEGAIEQIEAPSVDIMKIFEDVGFW